MIILRFLPTGRFYGCDMRKTVQIEEKIKKDFPDLLLDTQQIEAISRYLDLLSHWNKKINLTAIKDRNLMIGKLLFDSLMAFDTNQNHFSDIKLTGNILDLGSGAGIPGIFLAICDQKLDISSVDKSKKKILFQENAKAQLKLANFHPINSRLEDLAKYIGLSYRYDFIISRAFDQIKGIFTHSDRFLKPKGYLILWKGKKWKDEWDDVKSDIRERYQVKETKTYYFNDYKHGGIILVIQRLI